MPCASLRRCGLAADADGRRGASDGDLLRAHADGDPDAFGELVRRHRDRLWAVALRTLGDPRGGRRRPAGRPGLRLPRRLAAGRRFRGESAVTTWLHRIVVNACLDRVRRRAARPADPLPEHDALPARGPDAASRPARPRSTSTAALRPCPVEQRAALVLVDMYGWSVEDAAEVLECPPAP